MERKRVFEIKKRFEGLDENKAVTNGNAGFQLSTFSHKANNISPQSCRSEGLEQVDLTEKNIVFKRTNSTSSSVEGQNSCGKIKRSPAFRSSKNDFCVGSKVKVGGGQSKNVESPLPKGPAPRKPPRTFAHKVGSEVVDTPSLPTCSAQEAKMTDPDEKNNNKSTFKRSKTEPLIMLKKIETALKIHQASVKRMKEPPPPPPPTNGNIYDVPYDDQRQKSLPVQSSPTRPRHTPVGQVKSLQSPPSPVRPPTEPVYSEPCIVKSELRSPPGPKSSKSLYYMSSPIVDRDGNPRLPRNPTYEDALKKFSSTTTKPPIALKKMRAPEPSAPPVEVDSDAELDSDTESVKEIKPEVVEERKIYAKRVSSLRERSISLREVRTQRLMDALLLVGIDSDAINGKVAYIKSKYPYDADVPESIACLIFPDAENWPPAVYPPIHLTSENTNNYTIVLTSAEASRSYAYCRRLQPEGSTVCLPLAYAILTSHKANSFYYQILEEIENNHGLSEQNFKEFVRDLYNTDFPKECQSVRVGEMTLKRGMDPNETDGNEIFKLLKSIGVSNFIQLLSNMLLEKKIIIVSSYISSLSDAIQGLLKSIYPFEWQHTLITVIPSKMFEILQSPAPYVLGIMKSETSPFSGSLFRNLEYVFAIDVDKGQILANTHPSGPVLPGKLAKSLSVALSLYISRNDCTDTGLSEALTRLFVQLVGHYRSHLVSQVDCYPNQVRDFQRENFIRAPSSKSIRQFLEWFTEMSMFQVFIEEKKDRTRRIESSSLLFEQRCAEYVEENVNKKGTTLNKAVRNLGDRIKDSWRSS